MANRIENPTKKTTNSSKNKGGNTTTTRVRESDRGMEFQCWNLYSERLIPCRSPTFQLGNSYNGTCTLSQAPYNGRAQMVGLRRCRLEGEGGLVGRRASKDSGASEEKFMHWTTALRSRRRFCNHNVLASCR